MELANVVDHRIVQGIQQHQGNDRERTRLSDFSRLVKAELDRSHSAQVDPFGESAGASFSAEASEAVYPFVAEAAVPIAGRVVKHEQRVRDGFFETEKRKI